jgi:hypothetical protein
MKVEQSYSAAAFTETLHTKPPSIKALDVLATKLPHEKIEYPSFAAKLFSGSPAHHQ